MVAGALVLIGVMGLWDASMITLAQMIVAVAWRWRSGSRSGSLAGLSDRFLRVVTPVLDVMQIMPTFAYLRR